jgi:hypothetical protein
VFADSRYLRVRGRRHSEYHARQGGTTFDLVVPVIIAGVFALAGVVVSRKLE